MVNRLFLKILWHYKTLRGWWWAFQAVALLNQCHEEPKGYFDWISDIQASSWFLPAYQWPFSYMEKVLEKRRLEALKRMELMKRHAVWYAWRINKIFGLEVGKTRSLLEQGEWGELFELLARSEKEVFK